MTTSTSLLELLLNLLRDPNSLAAYRDDPEGFLASCGDVSPEDIREALILLQDNQDADFGREHNTGGNHIHVPAPADPPAPEPGESNQEAAIKYLNTYITNNHIDDRDTIVDNSINQQIDTGGGDFDQDIDVDSTVASGDDSVAAGDDIEDSENDSGDDEDDDERDGERDGDESDEDGDTVTGDDNESVQGDDNTTSFGDGDTTSTEIDGDVNVGEGGAFAAGGDATVDNSDSSTNDSFNDNSDNSTEDSFNTSSETTDNSDHSATGSFNDSSSHSESAYSSDDDSYSDTSATTVDSHDSTQESYDAVV
jgi:hypothetical protein